MNELPFTVFEKLFFWLLKHLNKKLLKKYFPLNEIDFQTTIDNLPNIYINEQVNHCIISFSLLLKNYTNYDLFIHFIEIHLVINDYRFLKYDKILLKNIKPKASIQFNVEIPLTYYQVRKVKQMSDHGNILNANFELKVPTKNIFGEIIFNKHLFERIEVKYIPSK